MEKLEYKNSPVLGFILNSKYYLYDRYSNSIFTVPRIFFEYLDDLISLDTDEFTQKYHNIFSKEEIIDLFKTLDYCQNDKKLINPNRIPKFTISSIYSNAKKVEKKLKKELTFLCINITEECNLRCEYCIFSGKYTKSRRHNSNNQIEWNYIEKGVNLFLEHSTDSNIRKIGFYGGEPLLYFDIIRKTINYVRSTCDNAIFTITTNATLLKDKILSFFVENNVEITISLDGPQNIHDKNRIFPNGVGSFNTVIKNIESIKRLHHDFFENNIKFSATLSPGKYKIKDLIDFFTYDMFPTLKRADLPLSLNYINYEENKYLSEVKYLDWTKKTENEIFKLYKKIHIKGINKTSEIPAVLRALPIHREMMYINLRSNIAFDEFKFFWPNGACIPGMRSIFLNSKGIFLPCEKLNSETEFCIGDVSTGFDIKKISQLIADYSREIAPLCSNCWAFRFCGECWTTAVKNGQISKDFRSQYCSYIKSYWARRLFLYTEIIEKNPKAFSYQGSIDYPEFMSHMINE